MQLTSTPQNILLAISAMESVILPELTSDVAKDAAGLISVTLKDVFQRHGPSKNVLQSCIVAGKILAWDIREELGLSPDADEKSSELPQNGTAASGIAASSFEDLSNQYTLLVEIISTLCEKLAASTPRKKTTERLLRRAAEWEFQYYRDLTQAVDSPKDLKITTEVPFSDFLRAFLSRKHGPVELKSFSAIPGGYGGKHTYLCTVQLADGQIEELVVRKSDLDPSISHGMFRIEQEYDFLKDLSKTGYPAPVPLDLVIREAGADGTFYTTKRLPGAAPGTFLEGVTTHSPEPILLQLAELMSRLHNTPLDTFENYLRKHDTLETLEETTSDRYRRILRSWKRYVSQVEHLPSPFVVWIFDWLENHIPEDNRRPVPVHGDFFVHNVLAEADGHVNAVLDWECADLGAPEQDIAYVQPHVSRQMDWEKFLSHYTSTGGKEIRPENFAFYHAYAAMKIFLNGNRIMLKMHHGATRDLKPIMVELRFLGAMMHMGLAATGKHHLGDSMDTPSDNAVKN